MALRLPLACEPRRILSDEQRIAWLRLIRTPNVGPVTFRELLNHCGGAEAALAALPELARRGGKGQSVRICTRPQAQRELELAAKAGARLVALEEPGYPRLLARIEAPPPLIYVKGERAIAERPMLAIVGARDASAAGRKITRTLAAALGAEGLVIVSGLARGIDAAAHEAALASGTVAVLAGGIDIVYPPEHARLQAAIGETGLLVAESPPGFEPRGQDFPRRNRIVSGMALGVLVVEAAKRSGSRITARFALEQGREVMAVPGNPLDPRAEGTNALLKEGATLVTEAGDVISVLEPILGAVALPMTAAEPAGEDAQPVELRIPETDRERVVEALGLHPTEIDEIARATGLDIRVVRIVLVELDLAGRLERHPGGMVSRTP